MKLKKLNMRGFSHDFLAVLFLVIFAVAGVGYLVASHADTTTGTILQVSPLTLSYSHAGITGTGKTAATMYWTSNGSGTFQLPSNATGITVTAKGDQCNGAPLMVVTVDGNTVMNQQVSATAFTTYSATVNINQGGHTIDVSFPNDYYLANQCDRNLYVQNIAFTGPVHLSTTPTGLTVSRRTPSSISLSWTAPTASGTTAYYIYRDGTKVGTSTNTTYTDSNLPSNNTSYTYTVATNSTVGLSPQSTAVSSATLPGAYNVIYLGSVESEATDETEYATLAKNPNVTPSLRADSMSETTTWSGKELNYYYTVASSDYTKCPSPNPYTSQTDGDSVLTDPYNQGLYMHEVVAVYAACNGWNWSAAANEINWGLLNGWVTTAKAHDKKVVWSEPASGWSTLLSNATAESYLKAWGNTLVPTFATNFTTPSNTVPAARASAVSAAQQYGTALGESVQSWYWRDPNWSFTATDATELGNYGHAAGASYYQIEGRADDMALGSTYMNGVNDFVAGLTGTVPAIQSGSSTPLPGAP